MTHAVLASRGCRAKSVDPPFREGPRVGLPKAGFGPADLKEYNRWKKTQAVYY